MKISSFLQNKLGLLLAPAFLLALASCGSYQYSGYEADGIYGESRPGIWEQEQQPQNNEVRPNNNSTYYKNLFAQQSEMYGEILEGDIFTDVDSYSSANGEGNYQEEGDIAYITGNAPWGQDPDSYTINIYNNNYGPYGPWRRGYYLGYAWGDPFYSYGYYDPFFPGYWGGPVAYGYGWGRPYWGISFGFGFGYPYGYGYGGYYNPYYSYPYYYHHGGYNYYNHNNIAYNEGRRNSRVYYSEGQNRRTTSSRNSSYSRSIRDIRNSNTSNYGTSRSRSSVNNDNRQIYTRTNRRTESARSYEYNRNSGNSNPTYRRSNSRSYESSSPRRSTPARTTTTRSSSPSRSSGTTRSSSGSSRSSRGGRGGI